MTAVDALTAAVHACDPDAGEWAARVEAAAIADHLAAAGWQLVPVGTVPTEARARRTDPSTSRAAAESIDDLTERQTGVLHALWEIGPCTDATLAERYDGLRERFGDDLYPPQTPQSLRSRRHELVEGGWVAPTGETGVSDTGRPAKVWRAVS